MPSTTVRYNYYPGHVIVLNMATFYSRYGHKQYRQIETEYQGNWYDDLIVLCYRDALWLFLTKNHKALLIK